MVAFSGRLVRPMCSTTSLINYGSQYYVHYCKYRDHKQREQLPALWAQSLQRTLRKMPAEMEPCLERVRALRASLCSIASRCFHTGPLHSKNTRPLSNLEQGRQKYSVDSQVFNQCVRHSGSVLREKLFAWFGSPNKPMDSLQSLSRKAFSVFIQGLS